MNKIMVAKRHEMTLEQQLQGALYAVVSLNMPTAITDGDHVAYVISREMYLEYFQLKNPNYVLGELRLDQTS